MAGEGARGMSREIKYQAWHTHEKKMYTVLALHVGEDGGVEVFDKWVTDVTSGEKDMAVKYFGVDEIELREFTGLKDKHGKEIYEGDIVRATLSDDNGQRVKEVTEEVHYEEGLLCPFYMRANYEEDWWKDSLIGGFEVIGNSYEHPHLVERISS